MWILDNTRIYVQEIPEEGKQIIARLQPLEGGTVHQIFGYENTMFKVNAVVVGSGALALLKAKSRDGATHILSGNYGYYKTVYLASISAKPRMIISQTVDTNLNCTDPVYDVTLDLYEV